MGLSYYTRNSTRREIKHFNYIFWILGGCALGMKKFLGQGSNLCHSSDNARSLTHCATRELQYISFLKAWQKLAESVTI